MVRFLQIRAYPAFARSCLVAAALTTAMLCSGNDRQVFSISTPLALYCPDEFELSDISTEPELRISLLPPLDVTVTAYSSTTAQTDATPFITASMTRVRPGVIALSRDLIRRYNPDAPFEYGDRVYLEGHGVFSVEDTMNKRYSRRADIWFASTSDAIEFGKKELTLSLVAASGGGGISHSSRRAASAPSK